MILLKYLILDIIFTTIAFFVYKKKELPKKLNKVLLINPSHLGDIVISTSLLSRLNALNNNIEISFVNL